MILSVGLQSCEKQVEPSFPSDSINIVGKWEIKQISGGFAGKTYVPNFKYLTIKADGEFGFYSDSLEIANGTITVDKNPDNELILKFNLDKSYPLSVVNMSTYFAKSIQLLDADTLILEDPCCDLFSYAFKKVKGK